MPRCNVPGLISAILYGDNNPIDTIIRLGAWRVGNKLIKHTRDTTRSIVVIWVKIFQTEKTKEIQLVRPTEVCGKL